MRLSALAVLVLILAGCQNPFSALGQFTEAERARLTPDSIVFTVKADLRDKQLAFNAYAAHPFCGAPGITTPCAEAEVVVRGQQVLDQAHAAVAAAETVVRANQGQPMDMIDALTAAQQGLNLVSAYLASEGVDAWR